MQEDSECTTKTRQEISAIQDIRGNIRISKETTTAVTELQTAIHRNIIK